MPRCSPMPVVHFYLYIFLGYQCNGAPLGLQKSHGEGIIRHTHKRTDIATTRPNRPGGPIRWKILGPCPVVDKQLSSVCKSCLSYPTILKTVLNGDFFRRRGGGGGVEKRGKKKKKKKKSRNLFKFVLVLLSASVERVGVSRMQDFWLYSLWNPYHRTQFFWGTRSSHWFFKVGKGTKWWVLANF